jgi:transcriptional regulator with XRE-family HTH domain
MLSTMNLTRTRNGLIQEDGRPIESPLKRVRVRRGLKQREVAAALKLDNGQYGRIEKGVGQTPQNAEAIAKFFGHEITEMQILYPERYILVEEMKPD